MHITPPADDYGLQKLKKSDAKREVKETGAVDAYPRIESTEERHEPKESLTSDRRKQRRRKEQRRQHDSRTLYDTRSQQERRKGSRRKSEQQPEQEQEQEAGPSSPGSHSIDDFV